MGKSIGEHTIDLRVETIVEDNHELLHIGKVRGHGWNSGRGME